MKLSILVPTHNRPHLFERCIRSIIPYLNDNIEVIVNNDSNDITEIPHPNIKYNYNQYSSVSDVYKFLLFQAKGDYVWYVEDDDYLTDNLNLMPYLYGDLIVGNYCPKYGTETLPYMTQFKDGMTDANTFATTLDVAKLQLGQYIFTRELILDFPFPPDNNLYNDYYLVLHCASKIVGAYIRTLRNVLYYQTKDGNDNLSFPDTKPSIPVTANYDFLSNYPSALHPIDKSQ